MLYSLSSPWIPLFRATVAVTFLTVSPTVRVPAQTASAQSHDTVTHLHFKTGQNRIVVTGSLSAKGPEAHEYSLDGKASERLKIVLEDLVPRGRKPNDNLVSMYHITFPSGKQYGMKGYDPFDGKLTETGLYHITVDVNHMASNRNEGRFRLTLIR